jgi:hypothetical protein
MTRKKKKAQPRRTPVKHENKSKAYFDKTYATIRKLLQAYGFDPDFLEAFPKQERRLLMYLQTEPPRFRIEEGHRVPRRLVDFVTESTHRFLRTHYFGDESIGLTYLELATCGMSFATMIQHEHQNCTFPPGQAEIIDSLAACFDCVRVSHDIAEVSKYIRQQMLMISKVNFRIYGYDWQFYSTSEGREHYIKSTVTLSSEEPKSIYFTHKQKERVAFRVRAGRVIKEPAYDAKINDFFISCTDRQPPLYLGIYIQSHALQRSKERMDIFPAHKRNYYIMEPLLYMHEVSASPTGRPMLLCYTMEGNKLVRFGYFPFIVQRKRLIVLTFLPLVSPDTFEGSYLQHRLGLQIEDTTYLGMDKLSFFCTVDFEQIPVLKEAFIATGIWDLVKYASHHPDVNFTVDQKKTLMVKKFFEQKMALDD